jgi:hypothetical protein
MDFFRWNTAGCGFDRNDEGERAATTAKGYLAMRAAMRERMTRERMISITALLVISIGFLVPKAAAQSDRYPKMGAMEAAQAHELEPDLRIRVVIFFSK